MDIYEKARDSGRVRNPAAVPVDFSEAKVVKTDKWLYKALVESKPMQRYLDTLISRARDSMEKIQMKADVALQIEWVIALDNSGSMAMYERNVQETLALVIEFLRKMECRFAVRHFV